MIANRPAPTRTGRWRWSLSAVPEKRRGLGRGLELLVGGPGEPELAHLPVETIHANPRQPRKRFDGEATSALPDHEGRRRLARQIIRRGMSVRAAERAARWAGAKTKPRKVPKFDPTLLERVRAAAERLTGFRARIVSGKLEIAFTDETELAELAEALEKA